MTSGWGAAVLAGGASRRMGRDKAMLLVDGLPMVRRVVDAVRSAGATQVIVVGGDQPVLTAAVGDGATVVPDDHPGEGPLGGLLTTFGHVDQGVVLVVACDLVAPDAGAMRVTVEALGGDGGADVAVSEVGGREQWMHAAWRTGTVAAGLAERFAAGERSVRRAVAQCRLRVAHVGGIGPAALADADTPADLERHRGQHPEWH